MDTLILFGAGVYAKKYKALLEYLNMDFNCFTDNDPSKWGTVLYGKEVIAPDRLKNFSGCRIIISSTHETAIRKQLAEMGIDRDIISLEELYGLCERKMSERDCRCVDTGSRETVFVDMYEGIGWGGTELWAANLAYGLKNTGYKVMLLGGMEQPGLEKKYESLTERIGVKKTISEMTALFEKNLPCILVNNFAGCAFMAASIVKRKCPDLVRIVSVIHSDSRTLFDSYMLMGKYTDKIFCVSSHIRNHMQELYDFDHKFCYTKEQPIETDISWKRRVNKNGVLRIGYAGRIVKQAKRADLLVDLVDFLEKKEIDYVLQIAGEGECMELVRRHIAKNSLQNKVQILGRLPKSEMDSFWKGQDVFVSVSEYEGASLSMLEAMGYACVPVVTDVSGAREFIERGKNGYICGVGDIEGIADSIAELATNRKLLEIYGEECRRIIQERCSPEEYIKYWKEKILGA